MSKRWIIVMLLMSVAFNLAVLGSFIYFRFINPLPEEFSPPSAPDHGPRGDGTGRIVTDLLHQNEQIKQARVTFIESKLTFVKELSKEDINEATLKQLMEASLAAHATLERLIGNQLIESRKGMSAEEAGEFFERRAEQMRHRQRQRVRKFRRFK
ncbi:MAG: hypothetical protein FJ042_05100 [Candidatus Cloacimonetes bacterium]|nr:hypothetical protein [Candidatus Cloacimonadota bacterium]